MIHDLAQRFFGKALARGETPNANTGSSGFDGYTEIRSRTPIHRLKVQGTVDVYFRRSQESAVVVGGDSKTACDGLTTRIRGSELRVSDSGGTSVNLGGVHIKMSARSSVFINGQRIDGSVTDAGRSAVLIAQPEAPDVHIAGSGDVDLTDIDQASLTLVIQGSGDIAATGKVETLAVKLMGSGDIDAAGLEAQQVSCASMGSGDIEVFASRGINARCMGSGDVCVHGDPRDRDTTVCGAGNLRFR